jgi:putative membrane protein
VEQNLNEGAQYNSFLPALNAILNGSAAIFLSFGYFFIKTSRPRAHRNVMIAAFFVSAAFLVSYLYYHFNFTSKHFEGSTLARRMYLTMLVSHILGAIILVPGVLTVLHYASKSNWISHRKWARWVWPLWMYISVTGVSIYVCLYGLF